MSDETNKVQDSLTMIVSEALITAFTMLLRVINEAPDELPREIVLKVVSIFCETGIKGEMKNIEEALTSSFPEVVPFIGTLDWGNQGEPGWLYNWMSLAVLESDL
ncbi:MAG: hypothetical protein ACO3YX_06325 [Candidatus Nanopelagicaceae bacterium]